MQFTLRSTRLGLRNSTTRVPFRYGNTCLTRCPQAVLEVQIETGGRLQAGFSGDCLPPGWFDKTPGRDFAQQIADMLEAASVAQAAYRQFAGRPTDFFSCWLAAHHAIHQAARLRGFGALLASFGASLVERAVIDALCRAAEVSFATAVRENLFDLDAGQVHAELQGLKPADWLPSRPLQEVFVRHTIGLSDPLTSAEIPPSERIDDGLPQAVEQYIEQTGTRYFKLKLCNEPVRDKQRLLALASLAEKHYGSDYRVTLDGNEQYKSSADFEALVELLQGTPELGTLLRNTLVLEQPLDRRIALEPAYTAGIRQLGRHLPVIIDESDADLHSYTQALELGYRGVSSKNCKGPIKSLLNAGLTWLRNECGSRNHLVMTGEDLCSVGIVATQADLCLAATLGLSHVERNGHHYHPGLSYLPAEQQSAALAAHPDFYAQNKGIIGPCVRHGRFEIASLQCAGFGFAVIPDSDAFTPAEHWQYGSLGLPAT